MLTVAISMSLDPLSSVLFLLYRSIYAKCVIWNNTNPGVRAMDSIPLSGAGTEILIDGGMHPLSS